MILQLERFCLYDFISGICANAVALSLRYTRTNRENAVDYDRANSNDIRFNIILSYLLLYIHIRVDSFSTQNTENAIVISESSRESQYFDIFNTRNATYYASLIDE